MKGNLLLVEDEKDLSESMSELFSDEGYKIFIADNGQEALKLLETLDIDCIVSDIKMPVMDGIKFMDAVRARGSKVPIIFYTGHGTEDMKKDLRFQGANDLLLKPDFTRLEIVIRDQMKKARETHWP